MFLNHSRRSTLVLLPQDVDLELHVVYARNSFLDEKCLELSSVNLMCSDQLTAKADLFNNSTVDACLKYWTLCKMII